LRGFRLHGFNNDSKKTIDSVLVGFQAAQDFIVAYANFAPGDTLEPDVP
jgi:uncharacterized protein YutD